MRLEFITHRAFRYSNTLLVTLNNRIYFRDRPSPGGLGAEMYLDPSGHSSHHINQIRPPGILSSNGINTPNSFSSATDLESAKNNLTISMPSF